MNSATFRKAVIYGTTIASFNVESLSFERLKNLQREEIDRRVERLREMTRF